MTYCANINKGLPAACAVALVLCAALPAPRAAAFSFWGGRKSEELRDAGTLFADGKYREAQELFQSVFEHSRDAGDRKLAYWFAGKCFEEIGAYDRALSNYQLAVRLYPKDMQLQLALARLYLSTGMLDRAAPVFLTMLKIDSGSFEGHTGLAEVYVRQGFLSRAQEHYKTALDSMSVRDAGLWRDYADCLFRQRKYAQARAAADHALSIAPEDAGIRLLSASIYRESGSDEAALAELEKAAGYAPERADIALRRALWLAAAGRTDAALAAAQTVLKTDSANPLAQFAAGLALWRAGKPAQAREYFARAASAENSPFIAAFSKELLSPTQSKTPAK